jgi:enoyl-CoA hydratase/carnithine racemase
MTDEPLVLVEWNDGWAELRINRPAKRNALSQAVVSEFLSGLEKIRASGRTVAVISASGPVFCAGADLKEWLPGPRPSDQLLDVISETDVFLIAKVERPVFGAGVSLVTVCPVLICSQNVTFALPEANQGVFPVPMPYLEAAVPRRRLVEIGVRGTPIQAAEALAWGLVTQVAPAEGVDGEVEQWIRDLLARPGVAHQARRYWQQQFTSPAFKERDAWMRQLGRPPLEAAPER